MTHENLRIFNKEALYSIVSIDLFWLFFPSATWYTKEPYQLSLESFHLPYS